LGSEKTGETFDLNVVKILKDYPITGPGKKGGRLGENP